MLASRLLWAQGAKHRKGVSPPQHCPEISASGAKGTALSGDAEDPPSEQHSEDSPPTAVRGSRGDPPAPGGVQRDEVRTRSWSSSVESVSQPQTHVCPHRTVHSGNAAERGNAHTGTNKAMCRACGRRAPSTGSQAPQHLAGTHPPTCPGVRHQPPRSTSVHGRERQVSVGFRKAMLPRIPHGIPHGHRVRCGVTGSGGGYTGPTALSCNFLQSLCVFQNNELKTT